MKFILLCLILVAVVCAVFIPFRKTASTSRYYPPLFVAAAGAAGATGVPPFGWK